MLLSNIWETAGICEVIYASKVIWRSWQYSAVFNDMKIEKLFIEGGAVTQNSGPDPFIVSDADTMLKYVTENKK